MLIGSQVDDTIDSGPPHGADGGEIMSGDGGIVVAPRLLARLRRGRHGGWRLWGRARLWDAEAVEGS